MPGGTVGTLLIIALCFGAAAYCFSHVTWAGPWTFPSVLWAVAGAIFLVVGIVIAALLIAARLG
jgi:hypothetical protein